jgi:hypothetical protein
VRVVAAALGAVASAACGGPRTPAPDPIGNEAPPSGLAIAFATIDREPEHFCDNKDLAVRAVDGGRVVAEHVIAGECTGACTPEAQAAGAQALAEAQAQVDAGASESLLDYNFTDCLHFAAVVGREVEAGGVRVAILVGEHPGPHDVPSRYFRLALIACGALFLGAEFGSTYTNRWQLDDLVVDATRDGLVVRAKDDPKPIDLYTLSLACAAGDEPVEKVLDTASP